MKLTKRSPLELTFWTILIAFLIGKFVFIIIGLYLIARLIERNNNG